MNLKEDLLRGLTEYGLEQPKGVEKYAMEPLTTSHHRQVFIKAPIISGRTIAFCLAALQNVDVTKNQTQVLVVLSSRVFAATICDITQKIGKFMNVRSRLCIGGTSVYEDLKELRETVPHIVFGTFGRIEQLIRRRALNVYNVRMLIFSLVDFNKYEAGHIKEILQKYFGKDRNELQIVIGSPKWPLECVQILGELMSRETTRILYTNEDGDFTFPKSEEVECIAEVSL